MVADLRGDHAAFVGALVLGERLEFVLVGRVCCDWRPTPLFPIYDSIRDAVGVC